jgi:putative membrane protein
MASPALAGAATVCVAGALIVSLMEFGPLSTHMAQHIALMNVLAPLAAIALVNYGFTAARPSSLWAATAVQIALLWGWHLPSMQNAVATSGSIAAAMHLSLFASALLFWICLLCVPARATWQGILALLLTGKLACLLAGLLVFAPRLLYAASTAGHPAHGATLADQQLAGLLMITACPLSYVMAGIVLAARMLADLRGFQKSPARG